MSSQTPPALEDQLIETWRLLCRSRFLPVASEHQPPVAVIVTGQPAAGKSVVMELLRCGPLKNESFAWIDPAELAALHPARVVLTRGGEWSVIDSLRADAAELASELLELAVGDRRSLVLECTFDGGDSAGRLVTWLIESGYAVQVFALDVPAEVSRKDYVERRRRTMRGATASIALDPDFHDEMLSGLEEAIEVLERTPDCVVHRITRAGRLLTSSGPDDLSRSQDDSMAQDDEAGVSHHVMPLHLQHPRLRPVEPAPAVGPPHLRLNRADFSESDWRRIQQRMQFIQTLRRCAEAEQGGF